MSAHDGDVPAAGAGRADSSCDMCSGSGWVDDWDTGEGCICSCTDGDPELL